MPPKESDQPQPRVSIVRIPRPPPQRLVVDDPVDANAVRHVVMHVTGEMVRLNGPHHRVIVEWCKRYSAATYTPQHVAADWLVYKRHVVQDMARKRKHDQFVFEMSTAVFKRQPITVNSS